MPILASGACGDLFLCSIRWFIVLGYVDTSASGLIEVLLIKGLIVQPPQVDHGQVALQHGCRALRRLERNAAAVDFAKASFAVADVDHQASTVLSFVFRLFVSFIGLQGGGWKFRIKTYVREDGWKF